MWRDHDIVRNMSSWSPMVALVILTRNTFVLYQCEWPMMIHSPLQAQYHISTPVVSHTHNCRPVLLVVHKQVSIRTTSQHSTVLQCVCSTVEVFQVERFLYTSQQKPEKYTTMRLALNNTCTVLSSS